MYLNLDNGDILFNHQLYKLKLSEAELFNLAYGAEWSPGQTSSTAAAIGNASMRSIGYITGIDMIYPAVVEEDGTIAYKLDPSDLTKKANGDPSVLTGADGDVMTIYEAMYFMFRFDETRNKYQIWFSKHSLPGFTLIPRHGVGIYPAYVDLAGDSKLRSISGVTPTTNKHRDEFRTYAQNKTAHPKWSQEPFWYYEIKYWLMLVEFLNMNSQTNLGQGASNASSGDWNSYNGYNPVWTTDGGSAAATGAGVVSATPADPNTANVRNGSIPLIVSNFVGGSSDLSTQMAIFHWQRDVFGHLWEWKDGINIHNSVADGARAFICKNPAHFADDTFTNYEFYKNIAEGDGYVSKFTEGSMLPLLTSGSSSNHCGDYHYTVFDTDPGVGFRGLYAGGNLNNGANDGLAYLNVNNPASNRNANIGSHLILCKNIEPYAATVPLGKTQNISQRNTGSFSRKFCYVQEKHNMNRKNNLIQKIYEKENIKRAFYNARKGKLHYREVKQIQANQDHYFSELQQTLQSGTFKNSSYEVVTKKTGGKTRQIYKLPFYPDRIVHHCILQVLQPIWMSVFIRDTYATIPGRGIHDGVYRLKNATKDTVNTRYCLKIDIKKYYPSIDHEVLKQIVRKKIKCSGTLQLLDEIIDSAPGIPIGNYVSQWFGNLYLAYFDHYVKEQLKVKHYFRYADDMVFLHVDKTFLHQALIDTGVYLKNNLNLTIKENYQIFPVDKRGIDFLGYRFYHGYTLVRKSIVQNFKTKINTNKATPQSHAAYWGWFKHANTHNLISKYFDMRKFSDFSSENTTLEGEKTKIHDILNKEIVVTGFRILNGKFETEKVLQLQFELNKNKHILFTGSEVLRNQIEKYNDQIPFETTIIKPHKYYTFS